MNYSITETSRLTGLSKYTLRYYEKEELIPQIKRDSKGYRIYTQQDLEWLTFLLNIRQTGMPISKIKKFSQMRFNTKTILTRRQMLVEHQQNILEQTRKLQKSMAAIDAKIARYDRYLKASDELKE
ncbi:MerR family transcriptional regulator [Liquorilactobacillus satsumensis]|uniref:MerR family transcriptional regulator n=1 Tax=Liquorilactobacillus TaxID=2767888 RepID=UPI000704B800|nr:MerR family transcriptional regulator [Liquorilactobacillus satsumensis]MCC7666243.1 MerR family transcriptional regulator [Liquorilactobacillus satsumensis]MCP9313680.1 MerR family transcriptional regulator [Liquorilactobacillus satsumensis]MCP9327902.1 MerR family transcriptional regulator [Liquorilactobacillus satsumensis]MCP9358082.1 MerR family transcriptional regulator [Liquorilactobacillus satsumensis]MCP9360834.1 MerR family transcriptional regulator [Liquorilactobacillus satsumensi